MAEGPPSLSDFAGITGNRGKRCWSLNHFRNRFASGIVFLTRCASPSFRYLRRGVEWLQLRGSGELTRADFAKAIERTDRQSRAILSELQANEIVQSVGQEEAEGPGRPAELFALTGTARLAFTAIRKPHRLPRRPPTAPRRRADPDRNVAAAA